MLRKILINNDDVPDAHAVPTSGSDAAASGFGDHENAPAASASSANNGDATANGTAPTTGETAGGTDATPNGTASAESTASADTALAALQAQLEEARTRAEEAEKRVIYAQAEFQNYRRRTEEQNKDLQRFANSEIIRSLLPVVDNFERAMAAAETTKSFEALISGVSGTLKQLQTFLQKAGVTPIEAVGKEFDPNYHEAIAHDEDSTHPANTVTEEMQRGYIMHDRVIRPSLVKVSQG